MCVACNHSHGLSSEDVKSIYINIYIRMMDYRTTGVRCGEAEKQASIGRKKKKPIFSIGASGETSDEDVFCVKFIPVILWLEKERLA